MEASRSGIPHRYEGWEEAAQDVAARHPDTTDKTRTTRAYLSGTDRRWMIAMLCGRTCLCALGLFTIPTVQLEREFSCYELSTSCILKEAHLCAQTSRLVFKEVKGKIGVQSEFGEGMPVRAREQ
jgi:hypothetical protein